MSISQAEAAPEAPSHGTQKSSGGRSAIVRVVFYGALIVLTVGMYNMPSPVGVGVIGVALSVVLLFMNIPVGVALALPGLYGIWCVNDYGSIVGTVSSIPYSEVASWSLTVLPLFIFMGMMLWRSGATSQLFDSAKVYFSWLPGGLAVTTAVAGAGLASVSGSTVASSFAIARVSLPEMFKANYSPSYAAAPVLMSGTLGQLIPPSIFAVIYAGVASTPVGPQLMAGILPGVLLAVIYIITLVIMAMARPQLAGGKVNKSTDSSPTQSHGKALAGFLPVVLLFLVVVGGISTGIVTATEAGALGGAGAIIIGAVLLKRREFSKQLRVALFESASSTATYLFLIVGALIFARMLSVTGLVSSVVHTIDEMNLSAMALILILIVMYLILGMFMSALTMMLVTVPLVLPLITLVGISPMWFGVFIIMMCEIAMVTPPIGILLFIVHGIAQKKEVNMGRKVSINSIFQGVGILMVPAAVMLALIIAFPQIVEWLPSLMASS